jgi:phosphatidylinositol phospholipase C, delta
MERVRHRRVPSSPANLSHVQPPPALLPTAAPPPPAGAGAATPPSKKAIATTDPSFAARPKTKMSAAVAALLVYTVGVKCRGINKKEEYAPEHVFSLSEVTTDKILKDGMVDLIKHSRTHLVRTYPKGMRLSSTNYEPHRYWSAGAQLVAINWQTYGMSFSFSSVVYRLANMAI